MNLRVGDSVRTLIALKDVDGNAILAGELGVVRYTGDQEGTGKILVRFALNAKAKTECMGLVVKHKSLFKKVEDANGNTDSRETKAGNPEKTA